MAIINLQASQLDSLLVPSVIYDITINKNTAAVKAYLCKNPLLIRQIVNFNQTLKMAYAYADQNKCMCPYKMLWKTEYAATNNVATTVITYAQQVDLYKYMIYYVRTSNLTYISRIALGIAQDVKLAINYITNNKNPCITCNQNLIFKGQNFVNYASFLNYLKQIGFYL